MEEANMNPVDLSPVLTDIPKPNYKSQLVKYAKITAIVLAVIVLIAVLAASIAASHGAALGAFAFLAFNYATIASSTVLGVGAIALGIFNFNNKPQQELHPSKREPELFPDRSEEKEIVFDEDSQVYQFPDLIGKRTIKQSKFSTQVKEGLQFTISNHNQEEGEGNYNFLNRILGLDRNETLLNSDYKLYQLYFLCNNLPFGLTSDEIFKLPLDERSEAARATVKLNGPQMIIQQPIEFLSNPGNRLLYTKNFQITIEFTNNTQPGGLPAIKIERNQI